MFSFPLPEYLIASIVVFALAGVAVRLIDHWLPVRIGLPAFFFCFSIFLVQALSPFSLFPFLAVAVACTAVLAAAAYGLIDRQLWIVFATLVGFVVLTKIDNIFFFLGASYLAFRTIEAGSQIPLLRDDFVDRDLAGAAVAHVFCPLTVVSGPINRFENAVEAIAGERTPVEPLDGSYRIALGLAKIYFLAGIMADIGLSTLVDNPSSITLIEAVVAMVGSFLTIYITFDGYTDICVGAGKLIGYRVDENFDRPLLATNLGIFWSRFHMTLTGFLRDYFVTPVMTTLVRSYGRRMWRTFAFVCVSMINFLIIGFWHGGGISALLLGLTHGIGFTVFFLNDKYLSPSVPERFFAFFPVRVFSCLLTLLWVSFATSFLFVDLAFWTEVLR